MSRIELDPAARAELDAAADHYEADYEGRGVRFYAAVERTLRVIAALPEWSSSKKVDPFPIKARFQFAYETGLRPSTLDALSVPEHYRKGSPTLTLTDEADKNRWGRELPLSPAARRALDRVCPEEGLIFGSHDYRPAFTKATDKALPKHLRGGRVNTAHFRYGDEWYAERSAVLEFYSEIEGIRINGVDLIHWNVEGLITHFKVMVRPLKAINILLQKMGEYLMKG